MENFIEIKQADPMSIMLPLSQYATEPEVKPKCQWINKKGDFAKLPCGKECTRHPRYCSAHIVMGENKENLDGGILPTKKSNESAPIQKKSGMSAFKPKEGGGFEKYEDDYEDLTIEELSEECQGCEEHAEDHEDYKVIPRRVDHYDLQIAKYRLLEKMMDLLISTL